MARERSPRGKRHLSDLSGRLAQAGRLLDSLSYQSVLSRGFALVRDEKGSPVRGTAGVLPGAALELEFAGSDKLPVVAGVAPDNPVAAPKAKRHVSKKKATSTDDQGQLF